MVFKRLFLVFICLLGIIEGLSAQESKTIFQQIQAENCHVFPPENTIIAFDVDGVLIDRGVVLNQMKIYWRFFKQLPWRDELDLTKMAFWVIWNKGEIERRVEMSRRGGEVLTFIGEHNPVFNKVLPDGKTIGQRLYELHLEGAAWYTTNKVIKALKERGYSVAIATNMQGKTFQDLLKTPHSLYSPADFIHIHTADSTPREATQAFTRKPQPEYFQSLASQSINALQASKSKNSAINPHYQIIFIDDRLKNVEAAVSSGAGKNYTITGILYKTTDQLKKDLQTLSILQGKNNAEQPDTVAAAST